MWPDRVSNPEPLAHDSDALPTALHGPNQERIRQRKERDRLSRSYAGPVYSGPLSPWAPTAT